MFDFFVRKLNIKSCSDTEKKKEKRIQILTLSIRSTSGKLFVILSIQNKTKLYFLYIKYNFLMVFQENSHNVTKSTKNYNFISHSCK